MPDLLPCHIRRAAALFRKTLAAGALDRDARECRFVQRQRVITADSVFWAFMMTLGGQPTQYISDVLRTLNDRQGWAIRYKPFWNRLAKPAFRDWMKGLFHRLSRELTVKILERVPGSAADFFSEILADDGSSFAVANGLRRAFPGRFTRFTPAAVELHARMSLTSDNVQSVVVAPDKEAERQFLLPARSLPPRSLSLRDRGYIDVEYFDQLKDTDAYLICRAPYEMKPTIVKVLAGLPARIAKKWVGKRLDELRRSNLRQDLDLLVSWLRKGRTITLRMCIRYVPEKKSWTWLLTNLPAERFSADTVGQLYRLRWQIELVFKDWKSYSNLRALQTEHPAIAEGFIWASLCAAFLKRALAHWTQLAIADRREISTRVCAMVGPRIMPRLAAWAANGFSYAALRDIFAFLAENAPRAHPARDRRRPRHIVGLRNAPLKD